MILVGDRPPDVLIGGSINPYMRRWWIIPRNRFINVYLHEFLRSDDERALHDHPWWNISILMDGAYTEHLPGGERVDRTAPAVVIRSAKHAHRIQVPLTVANLGRAKAVTLFITGPKIREWGFLCPQGWRHWTEFTRGYDPRTGASRGCEP